MTVGSADRRGFSTEVLDDIDMMSDSAGSVLNDLFDNVQAAAAGSESGS